MTAHLRIMRPFVISIVLGVVVNHQLSNVRDAFLKAQAVANQTVNSEPKTKKKENEKTKQKISLSTPSH